MAATTQVRLLVGTHYDYHGPCPVSFFDPPLLLVFVLCSLLLCLRSLSSFVRPFLCLRSSHFLAANSSLFFVFFFGLHTSWHRPLRLRLPLLLSLRSSLFFVFIFFVLVFVFVLVFFFVFMFFFFVYWLILHCPFYCCSSSSLLLRVSFRASSVVLCHCWSFLPCRSSSIIFFFLFGVFRFLLFFVFFCLLRLVILAIRPRRFTRPRYPRPPRRPRYPQGYQAAKPLWVGWVFMDEERHKMAA